MKRYMDLFWLFYINLFISMFTFGGGYIVIVMIRKYYVENKGFFEEDELMKIAAIAQSSPGAIAVNMSALAGYAVAGKKGLLISCMGAVLPPLLLLSLIFYFYSYMNEWTFVLAILKGMEAGAAALIAILLYDMYHLLIKEKELFYICMAPIVFILHYFFGCNIVLLLAGCIGCSFLKAFVALWKK